MKYDEFKEKLVKMIKLNFGEEQVVEGEIYGSNMFQLRETGTLHDIDAMYSEYLAGKTMGEIVKGVIEITEEQKKEIEEGKDHYYFTAKRWSTLDIANVLREEGLEASWNNIDAVLQQPILDELTCCNDYDWQIIHDAIRDAGLNE